MRKTRTKRKDILKMVGFTILSVGVLSTAFFGANRIALAESMNNTETLPPIAETYLPSEFQAEYVAFSTDDTLSYMQSEDVTLEYADMAARETALDAAFTPPASLTVIECEHSLAVPAYALSMEEAVQIGARYIWNVFGSTLDGKYLQMRFTNEDSQANTWWEGFVTAENPIVPDYVLCHPHVEYMFRIDGVTGGRIDITHSPEPPPLPCYSDSGNAAWMDAVLAYRAALVDAGWYKMDIYEQLAFSGISQELLQGYTETAISFAQSHFNNTTVANVRLNNLLVNRLVASGDGYTVDIAGFDFSVIDDTNREAIVGISTESAFRNLTYITTHHNDFIPSNP